MIAPRRRRFVTLTAVLVASLGLMAGCTGQTSPDSYTDGVRNNFIRGCTKTSVDDRVLGTAAEAKRYCTCAYGKIKEDVEFSEFKDLTNELTEEAGPLPEKFQKVYASCEVPGEGAASESSGSTTTTTEG